MLVYLHNTTIHTGLNADFVYVPCVCSNSIRPLCCAPICGPVNGVTEFQNDSIIRTNYSLSCIRCEQPARPTDRHQANLSMDATMAEQVQQHCIDRPSLMTSQITWSHRAGGRRHVHTKRLRSIWTIVPVNSA